MFFSVHILSTSHVVWIPQSGTCILSTFHVVWIPQSGPSYTQKETRMPSLIAGWTLPPHRSTFLDRSYLSVLMLHNINAAVGVYWKSSQNHPTHCRFLAQHLHALASWMRGHCYYLDVLVCFACRCATYPETAHVVCQRADLWYPGIDNVKLLCEKQILLVLSGAIRCVMWNRRHTGGWTLCSPSHHRYTRSDTSLLKAIYFRVLLTNGNRHMETNRHFFWFWQENPNQSSLWRFVSNTWLISGISLRRKSIARYPSPSAGIHI